MATVMSIASAMVQQLVKCSALEGAYHGIRVNGVACGVTNTNTRTKQDSMAMKLTVDENKKYLQLAAQDVPLMGRLTEPKEVAMSLLFLASEDSSFTTGEICRWPESDHRPLRRLRSLLEERILMSEILNF